MLGMNGGELVVIAVIALLVIGPERLPGYAQQLGRLVRELRRMASGAREQVRAELGPEFDDVDWQKLDPRQYDPRRIVREALQDAWDDPEPATTPEPAAKEPAAKDPAAKDPGRGPNFSDSRMKKAARPAGRPGGGASRPGGHHRPGPVRPRRDLSGLRSGRPRARRRRAASPASRRRAPARCAAGCARATSLPSTARAGSRRTAARPAAGPATRCPRR